MTSSGCDWESVKEYSIFVQMIDMTKLFDSSMTIFEMTRKKKQNPDQTKRETDIMEMLLITIFG